MAIFVYKPNHPLPFKKTPKGIQSTINQKKAFNPLDKLDSMYIYANNIN